MRYRGVIRKIFDTVSREVDEKQVVTTTTGKKLLNLNLQFLPRLVEHGYGLEITDFRIFEHSFQFDCIIWRRDKLRE